MEKTETDAIKSAVREALRDELQAFYIDREKHYRHHDFVEAWMLWTQTCKSTLLKTIIGALAIGALGMMMLGFIFKTGGKP